MACHAAWALSRAADITRAQQYQISPSLCPLMKHRRASSNAEIVAAAKSTHRGAGLRRVILTRAINVGGPGAEM